MKRVISFVLLFTLVLGMLPISSYALEEERSTVVYFEDGSYMTETLSIIPSRGSQTVTGSKAKNYYASDGELAWRAILTGTFTYTGSGATCTASSCSVTIYNSAWYTISKNATKSGNTASASVTMGKKLLGITVNTIPATVSLSCDANGNLS